MTEEVLERANELNKAIRERQGRLETLQETQKKCCGKTGDVMGRDFTVSIWDMGKNQKYVAGVSPESAKLALDTEIERTRQSIEKMKLEFENLQ